jgi:hypothetical protein
MRVKEHLSRKYSRVSGVSDPGLHSITASYFSNASNLEACEGTEEGASILPLVVTVLFPSVKTAAVFSSGHMASVAEGNSP